MKKNIFKKLFIILFIGFFIVSPIYADNTTLLDPCPLDKDSKIQDILNYGGCIINKSVIPLLFTVATAFFIYGVLQYFLNSSEEAKKEKGKQYMIWGIIALTVMISVWGLVGIVGNTFGLWDKKIIPQVSPQ